MNSNKISPILLSGMHRSGTSMVTDILNKCGLIIGNKLDLNNESLFFQRINIWMMSLLGSSWDNPKVFDKINKEIREDIVSQLKKIITSRANTLYFGWTNIIKKGSFNDISQSWGWKDPRNTFTESIWKEVFPGLRTIHIIRHPIDTSVSLMNRQAKEVELDIKRKKNSSNVVKALLSISHTNYNASMILNSYQDCFDLIESYYDQIIRTQSEQSIIIRFEDILSNPEVEIISLLEYCKIIIDPEKLSQILSNIDASRRYAYRTEESLIELEQVSQSLIDKMGY